jgi:hypothetical protein
LPQQRDAEFHSRDDLHHGGGAFAASHLRHLAFMNGHHSVFSGESQHGQDDSFSD